jgi:hypothetical protein
MIAGRAACLSLVATITPDQGNRRRLLAELKLLGGGVT